MVRVLLSAARRVRLHRAGCLLLVFSLLLTPAFAKRRKPAAEIPPPDLLLEGGRKLSYQRSLSSARDVRKKPGFWSKLVDVIAGEPEFKHMVRPYGVAVDSRGRVIVTDPSMHGVHVFDPAGHKYKFLQRIENRKDPMLAPQCVTVDDQDNIYVTDSKAGKVFIFDPGGKYRGTFGSLKGGEGFFKRPTGIAVDPETRHFYVSDTLRDRIYVLDSQGRVVRTIGQHGNGKGEFNFPTELLFRNGILAVVDAMNFRVQMFDRNGAFQGAIGGVGDSTGSFFRAKGIALDSENHLYVVEGLWGIVQVFDRQGRLLYSFGARGTRLGEFQLPAGLFIDQYDQVYVVDSYNQRVQVFQYQGPNTRAQGAKQ